MFLHECTACDQRQLIFPSQITGLTTTDSGADSGTAMVFTCWCGAEQTAPIGRRAGRRTTESAAA